MNGRSGQASRAHGVEPGEDLDGRAVRLNREIFQGHPSPRPTLRAIARCRSPGSRQVVSVYEGIKSPRTAKNHKWAPASRVRRRCVSVQNTRSTPPSRGARKAITAADRRSERQLRVVVRGLRSYPCFAGLSLHS